MSARDLYDALLLAAEHNTHRAQNPPEGLTDIDASLAAKNWSAAALAQIQAAVTLVRAANGKDRGSKS